jgi:hypothetical protein
VLKLVNYILEEKKILTAAAAAKEVNARADHLQVAQFIAGIWRIVSAKTIPLGVLNTQTWRCLVKLIVKMRYWKCAIWKLQSFIQFSLL